MNVVMELCVIAVTVSLVVIAMSTTRAMARLERAIEDFRLTSEAVRVSVAQAEAMAREVREAASSMQAFAPRLHGVVSRFEKLGERAARVSDAVLDEVEPPVRNALAVMGGVRAGARTLVDMWARRSRSAPMNGGVPHA